MEAQVDFSRFPLISHILWVVESTNCWDFHFLHLG